MMEDKWAVILWEYGHHADEFIIREVRGPFDFEKDQRIESDIESVGEYYVDIAPMKGVTNEV